MEMREVVVRTSRDGQGGHGGLRRREGSGSGSGAGDEGRDGGEGGCHKSTTAMSMRRRLDDDSGRRGGWCSQRMVGGGRGWRARKVVTRSTSIAAGSSSAVR